MRSCAPSLVAGAPAYALADGLRDRALWEPRFWSKVDCSAGPDACWPFLGSKDTPGYGRYRWRGRSEGAHRIAIELAQGVPPGWLHVLHRCPVPRRDCCNPAHLYLGDNAQNVADRQRGGTQARGLRHGMAKLSDGDVEEVRRLRARGVHVRLLAARFGVSKSLVSLIANGKRRSVEKSLSISPEAP